MIPSIKDDWWKKEKEEYIRIQSVLLGAGCLGEAQGQANYDTEHNEEATLWENVR